MKLSYLHIIGFILILASCEKEEKPVEPYNRGDVTLQSVSTGADGNYINQVFFSLSENKVVKTVSRETWDLAFASDNQTNAVKLNAANRMYAINMNTTNFNSVTTFSAPADDDKLHDYPVVGYKNYVLTDTVIGKVFVLDRGINAAINGGVPAPRGFKKVQLLAVNNNYYVIKHANVDGSSEYTDTVYRDNTINNVCFSFDNGGEVVDIEPNKTNWDLLFTQYTKRVFSSDFQMSQVYSVNGVLINENGTLGAKVFDKDFASITVADAGTYFLGDTVDVIGYDWKYFNLNNNQYAISPNRNYLLQGVNGFYYKLRFTDFYSTLGVKGTPSFEFAKI